MELLVVLPAPSAAASPRTVALALEAPPERVTVAALKAAIQRESARAYEAGTGCEGCGHCCGHAVGKREEEDDDDVMGGIPAALQRLTLGGRHLPDESTLAECAVTEYVAVMCVCYVFVVHAI